MVKLIAFFKRRPGLSPKAFQEHWRTPHAELVVRQAGLRRYVQNHAVGPKGQSQEPVYDGVAEAWFDDTESMRALASSPEYQAVREDEAHFIDASSMGVPAYQRSRCDRRARNRRQDDHLSQPASRCHPRFFPKILEGRPRPTGGGNPRASPVRAVPCPPWNLLGRTQSSL